MSSRRSNRVSTLAIVLPRPALPRRRSSLLSLSSSPRTPRSSGCASPTCHSWLFAAGNNRKSIDSWNSSNQDVGEDCDSEWKPEQILLLSRTLDALPSHLVTPFNGPIPPSNLLDKIARGVANAKGSAEWPHTLRATRVKLIEICRQRAKEEAQTPGRMLTDENDDISCYNPDSDASMGGPNRKDSTSRVRRPLYRQSSMDFMNVEDPKNTNERITRLSTRLQRADNVIPNSTYHPYTRTRSRAQTHSQTQASRDKTNRRSSSPPRPAHVPSLISPSTPSSSTLNSLSTLSSSAARSRMLRRTASSLTTSDSSMISRSSMSEQDGSNLLPSDIPAVDPRVQRVRRSESFCAPSPTGSFISPTSDEFPFPIVSSRTPPPHRQTFKRAPSYGTLAQEARDREKEIRASGVSIDKNRTSPCTSSDEEEKARDKKKRRADKGSSSTTPSPSKAKKKSSTKALANSESKSPSKSRATPSVRSSSRPASGTSEPFQPRAPRMNLQRNPSMFGAELPPLHIPSESSSDAVPPTPAQPLSNVETPRTVKTLRRVKRLKAPSRRISFGSLIAPPGEDADIEEEGEQILGSAFQLA
ncbi:hypothetical protein K435DRAFT_815545 [Dendrothele bispora CBS 962.96]|uniref:Uncharacterized protein n=1 Tax=Dendrothele bispora (strain CBS 962.96) TaxID=1314807 RepID=A0A4S8MWB3_DENBC|nr:hypothetical protein K435DRAFT_815545 [Dendrothele bispora CBS 962.96]